MIEIQKIRFNSDGGEKEIIPTKFIVFVGPANSGKSLALREIHSLYTGSPPSRHLRLVKNIQIKLPEKSEEALGLVRPYYQVNPNNPEPSITKNTVPQGRLGFSVPEEQIIEQYNNLDRGYISENNKAVVQLLGRMFCGLISSMDRLRLCRLVPMDGTRPFYSYQRELFLNTKALEEISKYTNEAFGKYFTIIKVKRNGPTITDPRVERVDWTEALSPAFCAKPLPVSEQEKLRNQPWYDAALGLEPINEKYSDGTVAFTGLVAACCANPEKVLLVDEPESHLHPPLARLLGRSLASITKDRDATIVIATHSSFLLSGILDVTKDLTIVRFKHNDHGAFVKHLEVTDVEMLMQDPMLRSTHVLEGLFYNGVIVCESDADRAFYEEINYRLQNNGGGAQNIQFINALGKESIHRIVKPLKNLGVPVAGVYDIDFLIDSSQRKAIYEVFNLTSQEQVYVDDFRSELLRELRAADKINIFKKYGAGSISNKLQLNLYEVLEFFATKGIFLVPNGQLESWLRSAGISESDKSKWVRQMFKLLELPASHPRYLPITDTDVWGFLEKIGNWLAS